MQSSDHPADLANQHQYIQEAPPITASVAPMACFLNTKVEYVLMVPSNNMALITGKLMPQLFTGVQSEWSWFSLLF